jgi:hypothetical protein
MPRASGSPAAQLQRQPAASSRVLHATPLRPGLNLGLGRELLSPAWAMEAARSPRYDLSRPGQSDGCPRSSGKQKTPAIRSPTLGLHFLPHSAANRASGPWLRRLPWPCTGEDDHRWSKSGRLLLFLFFSPYPFSPASHLSDGGAVVTARGGRRRDGAAAASPLASSRARLRLSAPLSSGLAVAPPDPSSKRG